MSAKELLFQEKSRDAILRGIEITAEAVAATLGPKGRNVVIEQSYGAPKITKDGVTVAKSIELSDKSENIGAQILKDAAVKCNDVAGDGTSTTSVLVAAMARLAFQKIQSGGLHAIGVQKGMLKALDSVIGYINEVKREIKEDDKEKFFEDVKKIATISSNGDPEIGANIAEAFKKIGKNGVITVEEGTDPQKISVNIVEGMNYDKGYVSPYFITNQEKMRVELDNPCILLYDKKISSVQQILSILESVVQSGRSLLIIAEDFENEVISTLIVNRLRMGLKVAAVKAPGFGDRRKAILEDIAVLIGGSVVSEEVGAKIESVKLSDLGVANKVMITKDNITILKSDDKEGSMRKRIDERVAMIRVQESASTSEYDKEKLRERIAKLSGGVAVLKVGGFTEMQIKERKDRVEDAYHASKAALEEGVVPGGGCTFLYAADRLDKISAADEAEKAGINIVCNSLSAVFKRVMTNAGLEPISVMHDLHKHNNNKMVYNVAAEKMVDAYEGGVIDPAKVLRIAIETAVSIISTLIFTECVIVEKEDKKTPSHAGRMGGMDDMGM